MRYFLFTDGASRGNPGAAAAGVVIKNEEGKNIAEKSQLLGRMTNNEAEYRALILGLISAKELVKQDDSLFVFMDSELVVSQVTGSFKVKAPHLKEIIKDVREQEKNFSNIRYQIIPREKNARADALANQALDSAL